MSEGQEVEVLWCLDREDEVGVGNERAEVNNFGRKTELIPIRLCLPPSTTSPTSSSGGSTKMQLQLPKDQISETPPAKKAKRVRRNYHKRVSRAQQQLRRVIQPAPNNNNEYLMQEHDDMYNFESQQFGSADDEDGGGMSGGRKLRGTHITPDAFYSQGTNSSQDDEEEFLTRDFSNAYDVVHTERLNSMSKNELIQEYQLLEERVESLERKMRTRHSLQQIQTGSGSPYQSSGSPYHTTGSPFHPASRGGYGSGGSDCIPIKLLEEEVRDLKEENRLLRYEIKMLGRKVTETTCDEENENEIE